MTGESWGISGAHVHQSRQGKPTARWGFQHMLGLTGWQDRAQHKSWAQSFVLFGNSHHASIDGAWGWGLGRQSPPD